MANGAAVRSFDVAGRRPDAPYPGSRPFSQTEQARFFGRATESRALAEFWQDNRVVLVAGPPACGKTSLLQAGVLPALARNHAHVLPAGRVSGCFTFPSVALPEHNPYTLALLHSWSADDVPARLVDLTIRDFLATRTRPPHDGPLYAAIDQVDDLLACSSPRRGHRDKFLAELAEAVEAEPRLHLLLLAREAGAGLVSAKLGGAARFDLAALTRRGASEAVARPVADSRRPFTDEAVERLVTSLQTSRIVIADGVERHLHSDRIEPSLLQVVCAQLWDLLPLDTGHVTEREVRLFGDVDKALAGYCGQVIASVADDFDRPVAWLRQWLLRAFITELGTRGMVYEGLTETAGAPNPIARALADRHLLSAELRSGARWYELLADRLIQPLREAVDELPPAVDPVARLSTAERALALGELNVAQRYAEVALRASADTDLRLHAVIESLLGDIAAERGEPLEAESRYRAAARLFEALGDTPAVAGQLAAVGQMLIAQDRAQDAIDQLEAAIERLPGDPVIQTDLALALWGLGEGRAAIGVLTAVLAMDGGNTVALRARGEILADLGDARKAMLDLDRVTLEKRPSTRAARGLALARLGDPSAANLEVDGAVAEAPWNGAVLLHAAKAKELNGEENAAAQLARRAVDASDPGLPAYHRDVALQLAGKKRDSRTRHAPRPHA